MRLEEQKTPVSGQESSDQSLEQDNGFNLPGTHPADSPVSEDPGMDWGQIALDPQTGEGQADMDLAASILAETTQQDIDSQLEPPFPPQEEFAPAPKARNWS